MRPFIYVLLAIVLFVAPISARAQSEPGAEARMISAYGSTPEQTMHNALRAKALRVNIALPYAVVSAAGTGPLFDYRPQAFLLQRFAFGWQIIELSRALCPRVRGISMSDQSRLLAGMPSDQNRNVGCDRIDTGSVQDITSIRKRMAGPVIPYVLVSGHYAYSVDFGDGGGCGLFRRASTSWERIGGCKGALTPGVVERYRIPLSTLCALHLEGEIRATCPRSKAIR